MKTNNNVMTQYIDKAALVAEIEKLKADALQKKSHCKRSGLERIMHQIGAYNKVISIIDTMEVKEVDLEKEIEEYAYSLPHGTTGSCSYVSDKKLPIARNFGIKHDWNYEAVENIAEHFFELGLKAQKGE